MSDYERALTTIAAFCFSVVVLLYQWLANNFLIPSNPLLQQAVSYFASVGFYAIIFRALALLYSRYAHKRVPLEFRVDGTWHYIQTIPATNSLRIGRCEIRQSIDNIVVIGNGFLPDSMELSNSWKSEVAKVDTHGLFLVYNSTGLRNTQRDRRGLITANLEGKPPTIMHGFWTDATPGDASGSITFYHNEDEYKKELQRLSSSPPTNTVLAP